MVNLEWLQPRQFDMLFLPVVNWSAIDAFSKLRKNNATKTEFVAASVDTITFIRAIITIGPAVAALLSSNALFLVLALPRAFSIARGAP